MSRITTTNYLADATTTFQYATDDNDSFDRNDLNYVAQALERHDHTPGRGIQLSSDSFADNSIGPTKIAPGAVGTAKIADGAVTQPKLGLLAVGTAQMADNSITAAKVQVDAINASHIAPNSVGSSEIVDGGVGTAEIVDLGVTNAKIAASTIDLGVKSANSSLTGAKVANNTLNGDQHIIPGTVTGNAGGSAIPVDSIHANRMVASLSAAEFTRWTGGAAVVPTAGIINGAVTAAKLGSDVVMVPMGAVVWFETAAEVATAGSHWARHTAADGKLLVGAGASVSGQTFTEATNPAAGTWTPADALTVAAIGATDSGGMFYTVSVTSGTGGATQTPPFAHTHAAPALNGKATVWLPPMRAGVWARRIN